MVQQEHQTESKISSQPSMCSSGISYTFRIDRRVRIIKSRQKKTTGILKSTKTVAANTFAGVLGVRTIIVRSSVLRKRKLKDKIDTVCTFILERMDGTLSLSPDRRMRVITCASATVMPC